MPQCIVEYLACTTKKQINKILRNFLQNLYFDLDYVQKYADNHVYVSDNTTYRVEVEVVFDKIVFNKNSTTVCHFRFIGKSVECIEAIKKGVGSYWDNYFDEIFVVRDDISMSRCTKSYDPIYQIEIDLRHLILRKLSSKDKWIKNLPISSSIRKKAEKNMKKDRDKYGSEMTGTNILQYLYLSNLIKIINNDSEVFDEFTDTDIKKLDRLKDIRNKIAHNRYLSKEDYIDVTRIYNELKKKLEISLNPFRNPP